MAVARKIGIVCLVTRVCLTNAILTAKESTDAAAARATVISRPWHSYLPAKHPQYAVHVDHAIVAHDLQKQPPAFAGDSRPERSKGLQSAASTSKHKSQANVRHRFPTEIHRDEVWLRAEVPSNASPSPSPPTTTMRATTKTTAMTTTAATTTTTLSRPRGIRDYQRNVPRRFSYQDIKELDRYLTDDLGDDKLPYRGKAESATYHRHEPQDVTTAIRALDRFLSESLNADSYNSQLHPPPNPVLALVLSRYGRYVPGTRNPRVYAHTAVNNMHNNKPFGIYKYECDEQPIYAAR